jgi:hypothetical protein
MIVTRYVPSDDDQTRRIAGVLESALNAPLSPEAQAFLDALPTRYEPHDTRFAVWVASCVAHAKLPYTAALRLIDDAKLDLLDVYPRIGDGEMVICPSDVSAWCRSHPGEEPRQTLQEWWQTVAH